ncbi:hypothetical protein [Streptomyces sp. TLI_171]|uniref:hypothetical protein n=1 Tax=Streptomyces sp. TLI_171 TaxID=1938859 RepID=UPI000C1A3C31|nr:hypothetical protein [Streptomyces sp. TLI_171]RKE19290.1 hypothetical protein BX266_2608 [Streptomyces sp. TLI_171]
MSHPPQPGAPAPGQQPYQPYQSQPQPQPPYQAQPPHPHQPPYQQPLPVGRQFQLPYQQQQFEPPVRPRRRGRRIAFTVAGVLAVLVLAFALLVVNNLNRQHQYAKDNVPEKKWRALVDGMTQALAAKDEEAFVKPFAPGPTQDKQRKVFRNLVKIPWQTARWELQAGDAVKGVLPVAFVHQVKGVDNRPIAETYAWTVSGPAAPGVVTAVGGDKDLMGGTSDVSYYPGPWEMYDELAVEVRDHLVVVSDRGQSAELERDVDVLAQAAKDDLAVWQQNKPPTDGVRSAAEGFFVVLEKNRDVYNKLYAGDGRENDRLEAGVNMAVEAADSDKAGQGKIMIGGSRIVMDTSLERFTSKDRWQEGVTDIGRHEMAHAIVAPLTADFDLGLVEDSTVRMWVIEGFADFMALHGKDAKARTDLAYKVKDFAFHDGLPPATAVEFYAKDPKERSANYALSADALRWMASKYGEARTLAFVAAHYGDPTGFQRQLTAATGLTPEQFQQQWAAHVRATLPVKR